MLEMVRDRQMMKTVRNRQNDRKSKCSVKSWKQLMIGKMIETIIGRNNDKQNKLYVELYKQLVIGKII